MPLTIPNTTVTSTQYSDALTFAGNDVFAWGFVTVANQPCFAQLFQGARGSAVPQDEIYLPPATYPITGGDKPISGIRFRANSLATPLPQVFGSLFFPREPGVQAGTPFTGVIAPGGGVGVVGVIDKNTALVDVAGTNVETDIYNFSVPGGALTSDGQLRLFIHGDFLYNNANGNTCTLRIYLGGVLLTSYAWGASALISATRRPWEIRPTFSALGATNSQMMTAELMSVPPDIGGGAAPVAGIGAWDARNNTPTLPAMGIGTPATSDMTVAQILRVTAQWSAASGNNSWRKRYAILEAVS